jgi:hypothetical protein
LKKKQVNNIFGWLDEIMLYKSNHSSFSNESWDKWNTYMVNRYLSMDINYIDVVNYVQKINPQNKQQIYSIYREMIPKKKLWLKYTKNENKKNYKEIPDYIAKYFKCSLKEANEYIYILRKSGVQEILGNMGLDEKETNKLIKGTKL